MIAKLFRTALPLACLAALAFPALASENEIPDDLQGVWAPQGKCDDASQTVEFGASTLAFGNEDEQPAVYFDKDSPEGYGAIHWAEEGVVSNFAYDPNEEVLLYNEQGYGMGVPPVVYDYCHD